MCIFAHFIDFGSKKAGLKARFIILDGSNRLAANLNLFPLPVTGIGVLDLAVLVPATGLLIDRLRLIDHRRLLIDRHAGIGRTGVLAQNTTNDKATNKCRSVFAARCRRCNHG